MSNETYADDVKDLFESGNHNGRRLGRRDRIYMGVRSQKGRGYCLQNPKALWWLLV